MLNLTCKGKGVTAVLFAKGGGLALSFNLCNLLNILCSAVTDSEPTNTNVHNTEDVKTGIKEEGRDDEQKSIIPVAHLYTLTKIGPALNR